MPEKKAGTGLKALALRALCVFLVTLLMIAAFLLGIVFIFSKGPSQSARNLFVMSVRETSAIDFLADMFVG